MSQPHLAMIIIIITLIWVVLSLSWVSAFGSFATKRETQDKSNRFFRFDEQSNSWILVDLPYDLVTCANGECKVVGSIREAPETKEGQTTTNDDVEVVNVQKKKDSFCRKKLLPLRKRASLTRMSDTSIWVTGESGSIYERFWNGVQWVIAPHDLPSSAGAAISVLTVNQTILALSEAGFLYQMQLTEKSELVWVEVAAATGGDRVLIKSAVLGNDNERIFFCTKNGTLLELTQIETPPRFVNHGQPPGADVAAIADVGTIRRNLVFTISSAGDLYEHDCNSKPPWKKHVWSEASIEDTSLIPLKGCTIQGIGGASSISLFLITKAGKLVERRLNQRKWKWIVHGSLENEFLTSITTVQQHNPSEKYSVFLSTASGSILEYQITKQAGVSNENQLQDPWVNHKHPQHAKVARGIPGLAYQFGRIFYTLDDGRLAELHLPGLGGENSGPIHQANNNRRKLPLKYTWSVLDAPESEGWNAEYCTEERGPSNCMAGVKDETNEFGSTRTITRRRKGTQLTYLIPDQSSSSVLEEITGRVEEEKWMNRNFHMRLMQGGRTFFMVTTGGLTFEYLYNDNVGLWLRHEHAIAMDGAVGSYNGSLFFVDVQGNVLIRERAGNELEWINCTAMKKGRQVIAGPPWDRIYKTGIKVTAQDALYFVSKSGRLLQFTVALRNFKWKDCKNPSNTKIATIIDQQVLRDKIVFVIGTNGRLYQYNALYGTWHEHHQSQHMVLSRLPGTSMRPSTLSLKGSLFMISEEGGLVEYHWNSQDGWMWVEHGTPNGRVSFTAAPGPSYEDHQLLFLIGSDGRVYLRYLEQMEWKWKDCGFPDAENLIIAQEGKEGKERHDGKESVCMDAAVARMRAPMVDLRDKIAGFRGGVEEALVRVREGIRQREEAANVREVLELLLDTFHVVSKVEKLIKELPSVPADWSNGDLGTVEKNHLSNGVSLQQSESESNVRETQSMLLERIASEMNRLKFYMAHAKDLPFIQNIEKRFQTASLLLDASLGHCFVDGLEHRDENAIYNCLRAYAAIDSTRNAEEIFRTTIVAPLIQKVIPHGSSGLIGEASGDILEADYQEIKQYIEKECTFLLQISSRENSGFHVFDFLANSILKEVLSALQKGKPGAFSPGRPTEFLKNYKSSIDFLSYLEGCCTSRYAVSKFRAAPVYIDFMKQWNLGVYFSLRFQEIAGALDSALTAPNLVVAQDSHNEDGKLPALALKQSVTLYESLRSCWSEDVLVLSCSDKFLRLSLQLLSRYSSWLSSVLRARSAGNANANPGLEWAISAATEDFIYVVHDIKLIVAEVCGDYLGRVIQLLSSCPTEVLDSVKQSILQSGKSLEEMVPLVIKSITESLVEKSVKEFLTQLNAITTTYRMTNKPLPVRHSPYVSGILRPLKDFLEGETATTYMDDTTKTEILQGTAVGITDRYHKSASNLVSVARKTASSLQKLRMTAQRRAGASSEVLDNNVSDTDKICMQLFLDIQEYGRNLAALGVNAADIEPYRLLWQCVAPQDMHNTIAF